MIAPTVGRIVHFGADPAAVIDPRAGVVAEVLDMLMNDEANYRVGLWVLGPHSLSYEPMVPYSEEPQPGHWSWPPRV